MRFAGTGRCWCRCKDRAGRAALAKGSWSGWIANVAGNPGRCHSIGQLKRSTVMVCCELADAGVLDVAFSGGEPLLRRDLPQFVRAGRERGLTVGTSTSGWPLTEASFPAGHPRRGECRETASDQRQQLAGTASAPQLQEANAGIGTESVSGAIGTSNVGSRSVPTTRACSTQSGLASRPGRFSAGAVSLVDVRQQFTAHRPFVSRSSLRRYGRCVAETVSSGADCG